MTRPLPTPEVLRSFDHEGEEVLVPVMCLRWKGKDQGERLWELPDGVTIQGPPPRTLGLRILRQDNGAYTVRLIWDRTALGWESLSREQLLASCLRPLLAQLGTDLWQFLDRAGRPVSAFPNYAA